MVARHAAYVTELSLIDVAVYPDKLTLALALCRLAQDRRQRFFLHGQFNPFLWLALLSKVIAPHQLYWHIWGADLYEESRALKLRIFYPLRRRAQKRIARVFATRGDLSFFQRRAPAVPGEVLYFPARGVSGRLAARRSAAPGTLTILVGNSGDPSNRHIEALREIRARFGLDVQLILPLGYPPRNELYIAQVRAAAYASFASERVTLLTERLDFTAYLKVLCQCDLGYFPFARQQGVGTLGLLIQLGVPFVLRRANPFCEDLREQGVPFLLSDDTFDADAVRKAQAELAAIDPGPIAFLGPAYVDGWVRAMQSLAASARAPGEIAGGA